MKQCSKHNVCLPTNNFYEGLRPETFITYLNLHPPNQTAISVAIILIAAALPIQPIPSEKCYCYILALYNRKQCYLVVYTL